MMCSKPEARSRLKTPRVARSCAALTNRLMTASAINDIVRCLFKFPRHEVTFLIFVRDRLRRHPNDPN